MRDREKIQNYKRQGNEHRHEAGKNLPGDLQIDGTGLFTGKERYGELYGSSALAGTDRSADEGRLDFGCENEDTTVALLSRHGDDGNFDQAEYLDRSYPRSYL